jgi:uncharacterized protein with GYD domain
MLLNWTDQGIKNVKDSPKRLDGVKKLAKDLGGEVKSFYMTLGAYDLVLIVDMPNNDKLASFGLKRWDRSAMCGPRLSGPTPRMTIAASLAA